MNDTPMKTLDFLADYSPCEEGAAFARQYETMAEAWDNCPRADWLVWICQQMKMSNDQQFRLFAVWCVRNLKVSSDKTVWDLLTHGRSRNAVEVAEKFANGEANAEELRAAWHAAHAVYGGIAKAVAHTPQLASAAYAANVALSVAIERAVSAAGKVAGWPVEAAEQVKQFRLMINNPFKSQTP